MALFPFFMDLTGKKVFVVGNGKHADEKIEKLMPYGPEIIRIEAEAFQESIQELSQESDLACVIVAGQNKEENHTIADICRARRILVNTVDDPQYCDFIFPSLISHGNLSIGICTNGASPSAGVLLKRKIEAQIPDHMEEILDYLQKKRPEIAKAFLDKKQRFACYYKLSELCMEEDRVLSEEEFQALMAAERVD